MIYLYIYLIITFLGGSRLFQSMKGLGMSCSWAFSLVCEVALSFVTPTVGEGEGRIERGGVKTLITIVEPR